MDNKVQEITDKIYREGVEKGQAEAKKIVEAAEAEKAAIMKAAQKEADKILAHAKKAAEELDKHTQAELQLYAERALEALKSEVASMVTDTVANVVVGEAVNNEWMQQLMHSSVLRREGQNFHECHGHLYPLYYQKESLSPECCLFLQP